MVDNNSELVDMLCDELPFTRTEAAVFIDSACRMYKIHFIEKRNGKGKRLIAQPTAEVKEIQRWIIKKYIKNLPIHNAATAYREGRNIFDHARPHVKNKYLLKVDFKDFFPSIRAHNFSKHIRKHLGISKPLAIDLARVLFRQDEKRRLSLAIGAPSSPSVSNTLLYEFDSQLSIFCQANNIQYTRYADDLALSTDTPKILDEALKFIEKLIKDIPYPKLSINNEKTVFTSKKFKRELTGLILSNDGNVSLGREKKRMIRTMAHKYSSGELHDSLIGRLKGFLAFAHSIEPIFAAKIREKIGEEKYNSLTNFQETNHQKKVQDF